MLQTFLIFLGCAIALFGVLALGFVIPPRPFRAHPAPAHPGLPQPLRPGLPAPVRRHFTETIGETPQRVETAVVWGRGQMRIRSVWLPFRFKAWYRPGESFYNRLEITWLQRPVLRGNDIYKSGQGSEVMDGREETGEHIDQALILSLWADAVWFPSVYVHESPARWEPVDDTSARLVFPFGEEEESLLAHFDPIDGRMTDLSGMRYFADEPEKEPWRVDLLSWKTFQGMLLPAQVAFARGESGSPYAYWNIDGIKYNVNVADMLG